MYGKKHSDETKKKMSISAKGIHQSLQSGRVLSEETKQKLREKNIGKLLSEDTKKKNKSKIITMFLEKTILCMEKNILPKLSKR
jgi:hypothetical protein